MTEETYTWRAVYRDEAILSEEDAEQGFGSCDLGRATSLELLSPYGELVHRVAVPDGATAVFFRRRQIALDGGGSEQGRSTVHCIGWKRQENAVYLFVFDDRTTLLTDDLQAV